METINGRSVNDKIRSHGVIALVNLRGDRVWFYPRGRLPNYLAAYLDAHDSYRLSLLSNFLVSLGNGVV